MGVYCTLYTGAALQISDKGLLEIQKSLRDSKPELERATATPFPCDDSDEEFGGLDWYEENEDIADLITHLSNENNDHANFIWLEKPMMAASIKGYLCSNCLVKIADLATDFPSTERKNQIIEKLVERGVNRVDAERVIGNSKTGMYLAIEQG